MTTGARSWVGVLGPLEARHRGRTVDLGGPRIQATLAVLAAFAGRAVSDDELIDTVWGDTPPASVRNSLQSHVSNIRRALGDPATVERVGEGYRLNLTEVDVDALEFETAIQRARNAAGEPERALAALDDALALWRGRPLTGLSDASGVQPVVVRLEEMFAGAQDERIELLLALGGHHVAAADLERLVAEAPFRERRRELQVLALYRSGQQAAALRALGAARATLVDELGIDPGPELRRLEALVLAQDQSLDWRPLDPRLADHGSPTAPSAAAPSHAAAPTRTLVGRTRELQRFRRVIDGLFDGLRPTGGVVLVAGEPGIGKTSLVEAVAAEAVERGVTAVWGRCSDVDGAPPLWPWAQILRELHRQMGHLPAVTSDSTVDAELAAIVPELGYGARQLDDGTDAVTARFRLFDAVESVLARIARRQPLLLVLDDIHWADPASLRALSFLAPAARSGPMLIVATYRSEAATPGSRLSEAVSELGRQVIDHHLLRGFDTAELATYASDHLDTDLDQAACAQLVERTGGNPYFVAEMLRLLHDSDSSMPTEIPVTVREVLRRRVSALPDDEIMLLETAAVLGQGAPIDVLAAMSNLEAGGVLSRLEAACAAGIISVTDAGRLQFAHALVREVLYEELSPGRRSQLHADAGRSLLELRASVVSRYRAEIATHLYRGAMAGSAGEAVEQLSLAAHEALRGRAFEDEVILRRRAVELAELVEVAPGRRYDLLADLTSALDRVGDAAESRVVARLAVDVAERLDEPSRIAEVLTGVTHANIWYRQPYGTTDTMLVDLLERLLDATPVDDAAARARLLATLAEARYYDNEPTTRAMALEAVVLAERVGDPQLIADVLFESFLALWRPTEITTCAQLGERMVDAATTGRLSPEVAIAGRAVARSFRLALGHPVDHRLGVDLAAVSVLRLPFLHAQLLWQDAGLALARGDVATARQRNVEAAGLVERATSYGGAVGWALMEWALRLHAGDGAGAAEVLLGRDDVPQPAGSRLAAMALAIVGHTDRAAEVLRAFPETLRPDWMWLIASCAEAELALCGLTDQRRVLEQLDLHREHVAQLGTMFHIGPVAFYTGRLRRASGDIVGAREDLGTAVEVGRRVGAPTWVTRAEAELDHVSATPNERSAADIG